MKLLQQIRKNSTVGVAHLFEDINFKPGVVTYNPYKLSPNDMTDIKWLNEDMLQVAYPMEYTLDVGWYSKSFTLKGIFRICIVKEHRWDSPVYEQEYKSVSELYELMKIAIDRINELIKEE
ncbi:hypothetical protein [Paenibacillus sp. Y412MC10]|uniref:hypothetical protein n=1 Tax=Geobacillus sp. (strain Y412MC10) TaxID=481743 RepID=UPI00119F187F|nr:hypothetical protein [Paenibacillus sp. Y412MC10]